MTKQEIWLVLPVFNEAKYIGKVLNKLENITHNIIVVDDGSDDHTADLLKASNLYFLRHQINLGKGAAMKTGADFAFAKLKARAVIFMDGDDQHDPQELKLFFAKLLSGSKVVFGERKMDHQMPLLRIIGNRVASLLVMLLFGAYVPDIPSGFKAISRDVYQKLRWQASGYEVELELAARVAKNKINYSTISINTIYHDLSKGMTLIDALQTIARVFILKLTL